MALVLRTSILAAGLAAVLAAGASAQSCELPFDLVDVANDPLAPDWCGVDFTWVHAQPSSQVEAAGVSLADFDNDGLLDIFFPNTHPAPHRLYRNLGGFAFEDVAASKGLADVDADAASATFFDYDHDGDLDLFLTSHLGSPALPLGPRFKLFRNMGAAGDFAFIDVTAAAGFVLAPTPKGTLWGWVSGVCAGDYDQDGWTDLFASWNAYLISAHDQWRLLRNAPNPMACDPQDPACSPRCFQDATLVSGLTGEYGGEPWQPRFWDVNRDGWPDLHVAQDNTLDLLLVSGCDGTFGDVATAVGLNGDPPEFRNEMGSALGDVDNDLDLDLHLTNIGLEDRFYRNDSVASALAFTDAGLLTGLNSSSWGWGSSFLDADNDGDLDHASVCDNFHAQHDSNQFHLNLYPSRLADGVNVAWQNVSEDLSDFTRIPVGDAARGLAAGDLDLDGDLDLVVSRTAGRAGVYRNTLLSANRWLQVDLVEAGGSLDVTGARVYVHDRGLTRMRQVDTGSSFLTQEPARLHFGLGAAASRSGSAAAPGAPGAAAGAGGVLGPATPSGGPAKGAAVAGQPPAWLVVRWPDGAAQVVKEPATGTLLVIARSSTDDTGDLDGDGHLTAIDQAMLLVATQDLATFRARYPESPGLITGDVNDDGLLDCEDLAAWALLPPH